jgi:hypothetical protein
MRSGVPHGISSWELSLAFSPLNRLAPALAKAAPAFTLGWLEPLRDFFRLLEVFCCGAPEKQASGNAPHGDRGVELCGHAEEAVFHGGRTGPLRKREARRRVIQGLNFLVLPELP